MWFLTSRLVAGGIGLVDPYVLISLLSKMTREYLPKVACCAGFYQRCARGKAESVDMSASFQVVQAIEHNLKASEEIYSVLLLFDVRLSRR